MPKKTRRAYPAPHEGKPPASRRSTRRAVAVAIILVLLTTTLAYWPGLNGPFLFDDAPNLGPVENLAAGKTGWREVVFGNESGLLGRPLSMASFAANAIILDASPASFKLGNLALHLLTGLVLFLLLVRIERRLYPKDHGLPVSPLILTAVWLLHPILVSTVLYSVQRMAILSAFFTLLTLLAYTSGRQRIENGHIRSGALAIFLAVPLLALFATLSKENGILALCLCVVIEFTIFNQPFGKRRPPTVRLFTWLFGAIPLIAGFAGLLVWPDLFLGDYQNRPFSWAERLLTQGRVLWDYAFGIVVPNGGRFSLFRDDYVVSTGLFSPITTLLAWVGWLIVIGLAVALRHRIPGFTFGIAFFLVGHSLESSILPLLMYFEHRNYLPAIGLLYALVSLIRAAAPAITPHLTKPDRLLFAATTLIILALAAATFSRSLIWQSEELLLTQSISRYPDSRHARMALAEIEMTRIIPNLDGAIGQYEHLRTLDRPSTRMIGTLGIVTASCFSTGHSNPTLADELFTETPEAVEADFLRATMALREVLERDACKGVSLAEVAERLAQMLDRASIPAEARSVWQMRTEAARMFGSASDTLRAIEQARIAWKTGGDINVGLLLVNLYIAEGQFRRAKDLVQELEDAVSSNRHEALDLLAAYKNRLTPGDPQ